MDSRFDEVRKAFKSRDLFLRGFPFFKRINRVYRFDGFL